MIAILFAFKALLFDFNCFSIPAAVPLEVLGLLPLPCRREGEGRGEERRGGEWKAPRARSAAVRNTSPLCVLDIFVGE